jgi:rRNA-processing protein FCF1
MTLVVIDTNYFLHDLEFIKNLHLNLPSDFMIFIPYIVIQELDSLKHMIQAREPKDSNSTYR